MTIVRGTNDPRHGLFDLAGNVSVDTRRGVRLGAAVQNAFDRYFEYVWYDGTQTLHSPASGRAVFLTLTVDR
jgi:outer membrane receptor protein involved in Fe transport